VAAQNHDQVGNRAKGERLTHLASPQRVKIGAALLLTAPFVPMLFQGEEWAASSPFQYFTAHEDQELGAQVVEGRRKEFGAFGWDPAAIPDPQAQATFERSRLRWDELAQAPHDEVLAWYRALVALRRATPSLRDGNHRAMEVTVDERRQLLVLRRGEIVVACNFSDTPARVDTPASARILLASTTGTEITGASVQLPAETVVILETERADA
jgi:maltooligosyltrehalose trehalohydrolase